MAPVEGLFWAFVLALAYVYAGYPAAVFVLGRLRPRDVRKAPCEPPVSILVAAHNEEATIAQAIENKLALDYPNDRLQIIVVSDASTDRTDEIVKAYAADDVVLLTQPTRAGKTAALNLAARHASGEVLVFADANSLYERDALAKLLHSFHDPEVGYVTGRLIYVDGRGGTSEEGCSAYMRYEDFVRRQETRVGSVVGVNGGVDAVRRSLFQPMRPDQLPDLVLPLAVREQGYRVVYEPEAVGREASLESWSEEYRMRVRVALRAFWALKDMRRLLNPARSGLYGLQLLSHKVLRYLAFPLVVGLLVSSAALAHTGPLYLGLFVGQVVFYSSALVGHWCWRRKGRRYAIVRLPYYFVLVNLAAAHACVKFLCGTRQVVWRPRTG